MSQDNLHSNDSVLPAPPLATPVLSYAAPGMSFTGAWREGNTFVTSRDAQLEDVCVKCGNPAEGWRWRKKVYWHTPGIFALILFPGILIYGIVALCVRKSAKIELGLCPVHRRRRRLGILYTTLLVVFGLPMLFGGIIQATDKHAPEIGVVALCLGLVMLVAACFTGWGMARVVYPNKIDNSIARYAGAGEQFLAQLGQQR